MSSVIDLILSYDAINEQGTFSEGDCINGKVILQLRKKIKIQSLDIKAKCDANVHWSEKHNDKTKNYSWHERFYKLKDFLIQETSKEIEFPPGSHVFPFKLRIPPINIPSSFRGTHGKIVHLLEARMCRSWRMDSTAKQEFSFVSRSQENYTGLSLMIPHVAETKKKFTFSSGKINMDVQVERIGFAPGETVHVRANIDNSSSKKLTPKFVLIESAHLKAGGSIKIEKNTFCKGVGDSIPGNTKRSVEASLKIPVDQCPTINNCSNITVLYKLKVYLDIAFHSDPEVKVPLVIIPVNYESKPGGAAGFSPSVVGGFPSCSDFPTSPPFKPHPPATSPGAYGPPNNQPYPQPPFLHSAEPTSHSPSSSSTVIHPPPPALTPFMYNKTPTPPIFNLTPSAPMYDPTSTAPMYNPTPAGPMYNPTPTAPMYNPTPTAPMYNHTLTGPMYDPTPTGPIYNPTPTGPMYDSTPTGPIYNPTLTGPMYDSTPIAIYNIFPNAPLTSDLEPPPSYSSLFTPSAPESTSSNNSDAK